MKSASRRSPFISEITKELAVKFQSKFERNVTSLDRHKDVRRRLVRGKSDNGSCKVDLKSRETERVLSLSRSECQRAAQSIAEHRSNRMIVVVL